MKYKVFYQNAGTININNFLEKIKYHTELFNSIFGENNWAYTGSASVILYTLKYLPSDIKTLNEPNDIDILVQSRQAISNNSIGNYIRDQKTLEKSVTFKNFKSGESIDITIIPKLKLLIIDNNPVLDINILLDDYDDFLSGNRVGDEPKIKILSQIKKLINNEDGTSKDFSHLNDIKGSLF